MSDDFDRQNKARWTAAIAQAFGDVPPDSARWTDLEAILRVLTPFMGQNLNHTMLPGSGGMDMEAIALSPEAGCIEFSPGNRVADTFRSSVLFFEHFPESAWNSFFLIETHPLQPCGVYEESDGKYEEVVELSPCEYIDRSHHDTGILGYTEDDEETPLPSTARVVGRHMQGKFLVAAKRSIWNLEPPTYDGRHDRMSARQIREVIQRAIDGA